MPLAQEVFSLSPRSFHAMIADVFGDQTDYQHLLKMRFPSDETSNSSPVHGSVSTKMRVLPLQQAANFRDTTFHGGRHVCAPFLSVCAQLRLTKRSYGAG